MDQWQFLAALAVPVVGVAGALFQKERTPGLLRRLRESSNALKEVPATSEAFKALDSLVVVQATAMARRESRRINPANLILALILSGIAGLSTYWLTFWCISVWGSPIGWLALVVSIIVGVFLMMLVGVGFTTIYNEPSSRRRDNVRDDGE